MAAISFLAWLLAFADTELADSANIPQADDAGLWSALIEQASNLGLPSQFLRAIQPGFIVVEFSDLRTFAAEYHPETHQMVLNRALSFNGAGRVLSPLTRMNHRDVATIYHELFHAYLDYISTVSDPHDLGPDAQRLLAFAREWQECRYSSVHVTPLPQKKTVTEPRFLSERESWEALNETWAVFVGWAIWTKLEVGGAGQPAREKFRKLLKKADKSGLLVGYYEPEDSKERSMTNKRYLAPANRISRSEVTLLSEIILGQKAVEAAWLASEMAPDPVPAAGIADCRKP